MSPRDSFGLTIFLIKVWTLWYIHTLSRVNHHISIFGWYHRRHAMQANKIHRDFETGVSRCYLLYWFLQYTIFKCIEPWGQENYCRSGVSLLLAPLALPLCYCTPIILLFCILILLWENGMTQTQCFFIVVVKLTNSMSSVFRLTRHPIWPGTGRRGGSIGRATGKWAEGGE